MKTENLVLPKCKYIRFKFKSIYLPDVAWLNKTEAKYYNFIESFDLPWVSTRVTPCQTNPLTSKHSDAVIHTKEALNKYFVQILDILLNDLAFLLRKNFEVGVMLVIGVCPVIIW